MIKHNFLIKYQKLWAAIFAVVGVGLVMSASHCRASGANGTRDFLHSMRTMLDSTSVVVEADLHRPGPGRTKEIGNGQSVIEIDGCLLSARPGEPMLPVLTITFLLPPEADLEGVTAFFSNPHFEKFPELIDIAPSPPAVYPTPNNHRLMWGRKAPASIENGRDKRIYGKNKFFPEHLIEVTARGLLRDWKLVELNIEVVRYNPVQKRAELLTGGTIQIVAPIENGYSANMADDAPLSYDPVQLDYLRHTIANPDDVNRFYPEKNLEEGDLHSADTSSPYRLAIITTEKIRRNASYFPNYVNFKISKGYQVKVVTEGPSQDADHYQSATYSKQRSINIRNWLIAYASVIDSVLLIGDPRYWPDDWDISVPMFYCFPFNGDSPIPLNNNGTKIDVPTDMFYAELSGDWDLDGDGIYGEYIGDFGYLGADKWPELHVGRIPFYGNYSDLNRILKRFVYFEDMNQTQTNYRDKVLISSAIANFAPSDSNGDGDTNDPNDISDPNSYTYGDDWGEEIKSLSSDYYRLPFTLYEKEGRVCPLTPCNLPLNKNNLINEWQTGYGYATWFAHGGADGAGRLIWDVDNFPNEGICNVPTEQRSEAFFEHFDVPRLNTVYPGFAVNLSCLNGYPETTYNLGTKLLQGWAVGTVTASRISVYGFGHWDLALINNGLNRGIGFRIFLNTAVFPNTLAGALNIARSAVDYTCHGSSAWNNALCYNMYGDPTLKLSSRRLPTEGKLTIQSPNGYGEFYIGEGLSITWTSENIVGNVSIDISRDGGMTWHNIIADTPDDGYQGWLATSASSDKCRIRIRSLSEPNIRDISDYNFSISDPPPPNTPTGLVASDGAFTDKVRLTWICAKYAQSYLIYRKVAGGTIYSNIGECFLTQYDDTSAANGITYDYIARSVNAIGEMSGFSSPDTGFVASTISIPSIPTGVNASDGTYIDKVLVSWNPSQGASFYKIYRSLFTGGIMLYGEIGQSTVPYYDDTSVEQGKTYSYKIIASNYLFNSGFSEADTGYIPLQISLPSTPSGLTASDGVFTDRVQLAWNTASNAEGYRIYRAPAIDGLVIYGQLGSSALPTYDDFTAEQGVNYSYMVSSYNTFFESNLSTPDTGFAAIEIVLPDIPSSVSATDGDFSDHINVSWSSASNALFYKVYRGVVSDGITLYTEIADTPDTSYDDYDVYGNLIYIYRIKAINDFGSSAYSNADEGYIIDCPFDFDMDDDIDGSDLQTLLDGFGSIYIEDDLKAFAEDFGRDDCINKQFF